MKRNAVVWGIATGIFISIINITIAFSQPTVTRNDLFRIDRVQYFTGEDNHWGYYRTEIAIPEGEIWRAVADVGEQGVVYVNGIKAGQKPELIRNQQYTGSITTFSIDLAPYLIAGQQNSIALYFVGFNDPNMIWPTTFFQGKIILATGETTLLDLTPDNEDLTWKINDKGTDGWTETGFNDSTWGNVVNLPIEKPKNSFYFNERWAGYDGRLVFENPTGNEDQLYYNYSDSSTINVLTPVGLSGTIHWEIHKVNEGGTYSAHSTGSQADFAQSATTKTYSLNLGNLERGIYTLQAYLENDGIVIESRLPEPLVVFGKIPLTEVEADSIEAGLDYSLEGEIDFTTEPSWKETIKPIGEAVDSSIVVTNGDLTYRETWSESNSGSMFSYQHTFQHPGDWYLLVLEYPDDARRKTGLSITRTEDYENYVPIDWSRTESGVSVISGIKFPLTNQMKELKWIHRADPGLHVIDVVTLLTGQPAAAKSLKIYHINGHLPALKVDSDKERRLGIYTERARHLGINFGIKDPSPLANTYNYMGFDMLQSRTQRLLWQLDVAEHYVEYMKFMGQNLHINGVYQYNGINTPYTPPDRIQTARVITDIQDVLLRVFNANNIDALANVQYTLHAPMMRSKALKVNGLTTDAFRPVDKTGTPATNHELFQQTRITSPEVQEAYFYMIEDLSLKFHKTPAWKGLYLWVGPTIGFPSFYAPLGYSMSGPPYPKPLNFDFADEVIEIFESQTGIDVPGTDGDEGRFMERYNFLVENELNKTDWLDWRCNYVHDLALRIRDSVHQYRNDAEIIQGFYVDIPGIDKWVHSDKSYLETLREFSLDPTLYKNDDHMWVSRYLYPTERNFQEGVNKFPHNAFLKSYASAWEHHVSPEVIAAYNQNENRRVVTLHETWTELDYYYQEAPDGNYKWPVGNRGRFLSKYSDRFALENFVQSMIGADPQMLIHGFTDVGIMVAHDQIMRNFTKIFTALPAQKFQETLGTTFTSNLVVRDLQLGNEYWFYVVNPGYWSTHAEIQLNNISAITNIRTNKTLTVSNNKLGLELEPYEIVAFKASGNGNISSFEIDDLSNEALAHVRGLISLGKYLYPQYANLCLLIQTDDDKQFIANQAELAEQDLLNKEYAAAWSKVTNWRYFRLAYDEVLHNVSAAPGFHDQQSAPFTVDLDASLSMSYREPIVSYTWNFGDGTDGLGKNTSHTYSDPGVYLVTLTVKDRAGRERSLMKEITICDENYADINNDGTIDDTDLDIVSTYFGKTAVDENWYERVDFDENDSIDIQDIIFVARRYGDACDGVSTLIPEGQIAYWPFENNLQDQVNGNEGTFFGGNETEAYVEGKFGKSFRFDGIDDFIDIPDDPSLNITDEMTISVWVNVDLEDTAPTHQPILIKIEGNEGFRFVVVSSAQLMLRVDNALVFDHYPDDDNWHHLAGVFDSGIAKLYIDGIMVQENDLGMEQISSTNSVFRLGKTIAGWLAEDAFFKGMMDDLRLYNRALTDQEVLKIYHHIVTDWEPVVNGTGPGDDTVSLTINPLTTERDISVNRSFSKNIEIADAQGVYAFQLELDYENEKLQAAIDENLTGHFLSNNGQDHIYCIPPDSSGQGKVKIACTCTGDAAGISGSGLLANVGFTINPPENFEQFPDTCEIVLSAIKVVDSKSVEIQKTITNGKIIVHNSPKILNTLKNTTVCEGEQAIFTILAEGEGLSYQWFKNDVPLSHTTHTLTIENAFLNDQGEYYCIVKNRFNTTKTSNTALLNVYPAYEETVKRSICEGESYFAGGADQKNSGSYRDIYFSILGCDSVVVTELTIQPIHQDTVKASVCEGESYYAEGADQTESGLYTDYYQNVPGCDSIVVTELTIQPIHQDTVNASICEGESYYAEGEDQTESGLYTDYYQNVPGCDSIVVTELTIQPIHQDTVNASICEGESYYAEGEDQTESGLYTNYYQGIFGCDSIVITDLAVYPVYETIVDTTIEEGNSYYAGGDDQTDEGTYFDYLRSTHGCDSTIITNLSISTGTTGTVYSFDNSINVFPIPTRKMLYIEANYLDHVKLFDVTGNFLYKTEDGKIDFSGYSEGFYFIRIVDIKGNNVTKKVIYKK